MSDINVISRTQHLIVDVPTKSVQVVNGLAEGTDRSTGVPNVSGIVLRGTAASTIPSAGSGGPIYLDPTGGVLQNKGTDLQIVNAGANTYQIRALTEGLYHINASMRSDTSPPNGSLAGIRVNGNCIRRMTFPNYSVTSLVIETEAYLNRDDLVSMFAYSTGATFTIAPVIQSAIDCYAPTLSVWRISTVNLVP